MKINARTAKAENKRLAKEFSDDMTRAGILCHIIKTTYDQSQEDVALKALREIKKKYGARYLPS